MEFNKRPVQLVRHLHEVLSGFKKALATGIEYMVQVKHDGVYAFFIFNVELDRWEAYSRTGKLYNNLDQLCLELHAAGIAPELVYIAEIRDPELSLEENSAIVNPNRKKPIEGEWTPCAWLHDCIPVDHFLDGYCPVSALERWEELTAQGCNELCNFEVVKTLRCVSPERIQILADGVIAKGGEGIVGKAQCADWKAGRKQHLSFKVVRGIDVDLKCVGWEEGKGKRQLQMANALCEFVNVQTGELEIIPVDLGKGFTDARRLELYLNPDQIVGKVVEVHALQHSSKGLLRLPKVNSIRVDKDEADNG